MGIAKMRGLVCVWRRWTPVPPHAGLAGRERAAADIRSAGLLLPPDQPVCPAPLHALVAAVRPHSSRTGSASA